MSLTPKQKLAAAVIGGIFLVAAYQVEKHKPKDTPQPQPRATVAPSSSPASSPQQIGSQEQRLAVASEIRHALLDNNVPVKVVASGTRLKIFYEVAGIEFTPEQFIKNQGKEGMVRMADAGFDVLIIEAKNYSSGQYEQREISLIEYRTK